jgi:hypothetical protein
VLARHGPASNRLRNPKARTENCLIFMTPFPWKYAAAGAGRNH